MQLTTDETESRLNEITLKASSLVKDEEGFVYRDLNKNGRLDPYENPRQPLEGRIDDLLGRMTQEEKAGMMFMDGVVVNEDGSLEEKPNAMGFGGVAVNQLREGKQNHFNIWQIPGAQSLAIWHNNLQKAAEETRLGIPVTIASDPRNHFSKNIFAMAANEFSQWCETLGFGAIGDAELVRAFADIVRQEYVAVGIRVALHPQIDLATEPRWARISGTFGEDAHLSAALGAVPCSRCRFHVAVRARALCVAQTEGPGFPQGPSRAWAGLRPRRRRSPPRVLVLAVLPVDEGEENDDGDPRCNPELCAPLLIPDPVLHESLRSVLTVQESRDLTRRASGAGRTTMRTTTDLARRRVEDQADRCTPLSPAIA